MSKNFIYWKAYFVFSWFFFFVAFAHFIIRTIKTNEMLIIQKEHKQQICSSLYVIKWIKDVTLVPWDYLKSTKNLLKCTRLHLFESHLEKSKLKDCYKGSKHTEKQHIPILILNTSKVLLWPDLLVLPLRKIILLNFFLITLIFDLHILYNSGLYNKKIINVKLWTILFLKVNTIFLWPMTLKQST